MTEYKGRDSQRDCGGEKSMKVILSALNAKYVHSNPAVYDLEAYAKSRLEPCPVQVREYTINHNLDYILQQLYREKAQVYAFSCYIWNIYEILTISRELNKVLPYSRIWLGGPEASNDAEKYLKNFPFIEGIILGEGEVTFCELTALWSGMGQGSTPDYRDVPGIMCRLKDGGVYRTAKRPLMPLDDLPFVYQDLNRFKNKILYYETSRGCPFSCSYCLSSIDRKVRFRSFPLVKKELDFFLENRVPQVKFVDRTFNCKKDHSLQIWRYILENDNGVTNFHFEVAADLIGDEEFEIFSKMRPGLIQLEIGLQSTNPDTIREIRRVMDVEKVKKTLLTIHDFGNIHQHLDLIAGLPYEDLATFRKSFNDAYAMKPNQLQLGFLKVLKGSYMGEQTDRYRLQYRDVQPYEVLSTKWISYEEILTLKKVEEMVEVYYNSDQFEHVLPYIINFFDTPYDFYESLGNYYEKNDLFGLGFRREKRYAVLRGYCMQLDNSGFSVDILDCLLSFDYYLRENAKNRPEWMGQDGIDRTAYNQFFKRAGNREISLMHDGYDSKAAARSMHIEKLSKEAVEWITDEGENIQYALFDYGKRNPLSRDAAVIFLSDL